MTSHSYALPMLVTDLSRRPGVHRHVASIRGAAMEVAAKAVEFLSLPFQTWYRAAVIRQSIRELGRCDDRLLRDIAGNRSRIACVTLLATARDRSDLRSHDV